MTVVAFFSMGLPEMLLICVVALLIFGGKLPEVMQNLGRTYAKFRRKSAAKIDELRAEAGAVFLVAHQLDSIKEMCNRVLWIDEGTMVMDGDPDTVVDAYTEATGK